MRFIKKVFTIFTNIYLLFFFAGFSLASAMYFKTESTYESEIFAAISDYIVKDSIGKNNDDTFFVRALNIANSFEHNRLEVFKNQEIEGWKAQIFHPTTVDLMTGNGACGSASTILGRILKSNNFKIRFAQMVVNGQPGGHIVIEANKKGKWVVLDPLYDLYFKDSIGNFASFDEVHKNFETYKKQLPKNYPLEYNYAGVSYTNWNKIKIIGPAIKSMLNFFMGKEKADKISIRSYIIRNYNLLYILTSAICIFLFMLIGWKFWKNKKQKITVA